MKRLIATVLSVVLSAGLTAAVLTGCGGSSASYNVEDVAVSVAQVCKIESPADFTADEMQFDMNLEDGSYEEFAGQRTTTNGQSGTVLVVKAKAGEADTVKAALEAYRDGLVAQFENYKDDFPVGYEQNKNGRVVVKGDYVVLAIAGADVSYDDVDKTIDEAMK